MADEDPFATATPNPTQMMQLEAVRKAARAFGIVLNANLPAGPDKTYVLRTFRTAMMWASVAIMKNPDGTRRTVKPEDYPPDHPVSGDLGSVPM
jgi:hypothetical protein